VLTIILLWSGGAGRAAAGLRACLLAGPAAQCHRWLRQRLVDAECDPRL